MQKWKQVAHYTGGLEGSGRVQAVYRFVLDVGNTIHKTAVQHNSSNTRRPADLPTRAPTAVNAHLPAWEGNSPTWTLILLFPALQDFLVTRVQERQRAEPAARGRFRGKPNYQPTKSSPLLPPQNFSHRGLNDETENKCKHSFLRFYRLSSFYLSSTTIPHTVWSDPVGTEISMSSDDQQRGLCLRGTQSRVRTEQKHLLFPLVMALEVTVGCLPHTP